MDLQLEGKTAVVTGASRGVGLAVVRRLAGEGVRVLGTARTVTPELADAADVTCSADLSGPEGPRALVETALTQLGGIDLVVNNAGGGDAPNAAGSSRSPTTTGRT